MGIWGAGIFQNDTAADIKDEYTELLRDGLSPQAASRAMLAQNREILDMGGYDALEFWLGLAQIQWTYGRLQPDVKDAALQQLADHHHLAVWQAENPKLLSKRAAEMEAFAQRMNTAQPPEKKVKPFAPFECVWQVGDIFAYPLQSEESIRRGLYGHFLAFQKTGTKEAYPRLTIPVLRVAKKIFPVLPSMQAYLAEKSLPQFWAPENYVASEDAFRIKLDDVLYQAAIPVKSLKSYPKNTVFLGNHLPIAEEYLERKEDSHELFGWKSFEESFFTMFDIWRDIDITTLL